MAGDEWWRGAVIYQVYPRSFQDTTGNGIGDLPGITQRLEHIASLGVDALWISPFFKSPMADYGYDVEDFRAVDPLFGTLKDFDLLLEKTHRVGMRLLVDFVPCHTSDRHAWFQEARQSRDNPKADWYVFADPKPDGTPPNNWLSIFGGVAWSWEPRRRQYYLHNFLNTQPQLNWHHPAVAQAMVAEAEFWLARGVDGFRLDAIDFALHDQALRDNPVRPKDQLIAGGMADGSPFAHQIHRYQKGHPDVPRKVLGPLRDLASRYDSAFLLGELSGHGALDRAARYSGKGGLDAAYTFDLLRCTADDAPIASIVAEFETKAGDGWPCWSLGNHDVIRAVSRFGAADAAATLQPLLTAMLASLKGAICLYQGEELGLTEADVAYEDLQDPYGIAFYPAFKGRDGCRTPMPWRAEAPASGFTAGKPWLPVPDDHLSRAVDRQEEAQGSVLNRTRQFLQWRRQQPALLAGSIHILETPEPILAFERTLEDQRLLCAFNLGPKAVSFAGPPSVKRLEGHGFEPMPSNGETITLPGYGALFGGLDAPSS